MLSRLTSAARRIAPGPVRRALDSILLLRSPLFDAAYTASVRRGVHPAPRRRERRRTAERHTRVRRPAHPGAPTRRPAAGLRALATAWHATARPDLPTHPLLEPTWLGARTTVPADLPLALAYSRRRALQTHAPHPLVDPRALEATWPLQRSPAGPLIGFVTATPAARRRHPPSALWNPADGDPAAAVRRAWDALTRDRLNLDPLDDAGSTHRQPTLILATDPGNALTLAAALDGAGIPEAIIVVAGDHTGADRILLTTTAARLAGRGRLVTLPPGGDPLMWQAEWLSRQPGETLLVLLTGHPSPRLATLISEGLAEVRSGRSDLAEVLEPAVSERSDPAWSRALICRARHWHRIDATATGAAGHPLGQAPQAHTRSMAADHPRADLGSRVTAALDAVITTAGATERIAVPGMATASSRDDPPAVGARTRPPALRWSIRTAVTAATLQANWGDTWFAADLAAALARLGQHVVVDSLASRSRTSLGCEDVTLVLRGKDSLRGATDDLANRAAVRMIWVISNPESIADDELVDVDIVAAASQTWATAASQRLRRPVLTLLQCTDPHRFRPPAGAAAPASRRERPVLFIGGARDGVRPVVAAALGAGAEVAVHGHGWTGLLPPGVLHSTHLPRSEVPAAYADATVVLNDHEPQMQRHGFWSNRLFDAVAAGARVLSDTPAGASQVQADALFGGSVRLFTTPAQAAGLLLDPAAAWPDDAAREQAAEQVRHRHCFDARAAVLLDSALSSHRPTACPGG
ncbi:MAG: hypothetical protein KGP10_01855 [Actinomycetales bacterium]|nr:hypothetical protein [Actinomycetales bacterium]